MERWSSGLRHTLGKRARLTASAGSNPVLSATDAIYCGFEIFQTQHIVSFFFSTQFFDPFLGQNCIRIKKFRSIFTFSNGIYFLFGVARYSEIKPIIKQSVKDFGGNLVARDSQINPKKQ